MLKIRQFICFLAIILTAQSAFAALTLVDYERWQQYNGWPIRVIEFPGIKSFARVDLLTVMATEKPSWLRRYVRFGLRTTFYTDNFAADMFRVERFYQREGFPYAQVQGYVIPDTSRRELRIKVVISEGVPIVLKSWQIIMGSEKGAGVDSARWSNLMPIKIGKRLASSDIIISADTLRYKLRQIGHARARVETTVETDSLHNTAHLIFTLYPGHFAWLGKTQIAGLKQIEEPAARRELAYHENDPFSPLKLEETRKRLVSLEAFTFVNVDADTSTPGDTLAVYIRTQEGTRYRFRFGGGYDTERKARAQAEFKDLNFFGHARRFTFSGELAEYIRNMQIRLFWPHTPWNATDVTFNPVWQVKNDPGFIEEKRTETTILSSSPLDYVNISFSNEIGREQLKQRDDNTTTYSTTSKESFSLGWDTRDNPLVPRKGHFIGTTLTESGAFYRTDNRWWRTILQGRVLIPANRFTVLAGKSELGLMGVLHESHVTPINERFYLGGPSTVRGWQRNRLSPRAQDDSNTPIGGNISFQMTAEVRRDIWGPVGFILFCDAGNVWRNKEDYKPLDLYPSIGVGLAIFSPVGPIRIDYGYQIRSNPFRESRSAVSFSLGNPF